MEPATSTIMTSVTDAYSNIYYGHLHQNGVMKKHGPRPANTGAWQKWRLDLDYYLFPRGGARSARPPNSLGSTSGAMSWMSSWVSAAGSMIFIFARVCCMVAKVDNNTSRMSHTLTLYRELHTDQYMLFQEMQKWLSISCIFCCFGIVVGSLQPSQPVCLSNLSILLMCHTCKVAQNQSSPDHLKQDPVYVHNASGTSMFNLTSGSSGLREFHTPQKMDGGLKKYMTPNLEGTMKWKANPFIVKQVVPTTGSPLQYAKVAKQGPQGTTLQPLHCFPTWAHRWIGKIFLVPKVTSESELVQWVDEILAKHV